MPAPRDREERVERKLAARRRARAALVKPKRREPLDPSIIPSEERMLANLERTWNYAEPGEAGRTNDAPAKRHLD